MLAGFFVKVDDWINPIVVKECARRSEPAGRSALMLFLGFSCSSWRCFSRCLQGRQRRASTPAGRGLFQRATGHPAGHLHGADPVYTGIRLGAERSDTNVDLLFISTLKPRRSSPASSSRPLVLAMLVFSCCTPFMTFTYLLRGIDIPTIFAF